MYLGKLIFFIFLLSCSSMRSGEFVKLESKGDIHLLAQRYGVSTEEILEQNKDIYDGCWVFIPHRRGKKNEIAIEKTSVVKPKRNQGVVLDFKWPLEKHYHISSKYGPRRGRAHEGIDIVAPHGTKILASYDGKVVFSGWMRGYGLIVVLEHEKNFKTAYAHASRVLLRKGKFVKKGQTIALVGNTGRSTGSHLHYEIRLHNEAIDPSDFFFAANVIAQGL